MHFLHRHNTAGAASADSDGAAAGGLIAALELGYQEAKQGVWMARGFVAALLDAGGAAEVHAAASPAGARSHALLPNRSARTDGTAC